jgi:hypothetical protein
MTPKSTQDLLFLHLFNELPPVGRNQFEHLLISDASLQQEYAEYAAIVGALQMPMLEPSKSRLQQLLDYAASV